MLAPEVGLRQPSAILHRATAGGVYRAFRPNQELGRGLRDDIEQRKFSKREGNRYASKGGDQWRTRERSLLEALQKL
jgi:hypothetical protein